SRERRILIVALRVGMAAARDQRVGDFAEGARLWKRLVGSALRKRGAGALRSGGAVGHDVLLSAGTGPQVKRRSTAQVVWQYEIRSAAGCQRARRRQVLHNRISLARSHPNLLVARRARWQGRRGHTTSGACGAGAAGGARPGERAHGREAAWAGGVA